MNKSEQREVTKLTNYMSAASTHPYLIGTVARGLSALIRATRGRHTRSELIYVASSWPKVMTHTDFII